MNGLQHVISRGRCALGAAMVATALIGAGWLAPGRAAADGPQPGAPWPQFGRDGTRAALSSVNGPATPVRAWVFNTGSAILSGPVIGADGTIYVGTENFRIHAIRSDGTERWTFVVPDGSGPPTHPLITSRDRIVFGTETGIIFGLKPDGGEQWRFDTRNAPYGSDDPQAVRGHPVIATNYPNVLIGTDAGNLYELDDGVYVGVRRATDSIRAGAAVSPDGTVIWASYDRHLYGGLASGGDKWRFPLDAIVNSTPAVGTDSTIYVATNAGSVYAVRTDGTQKWRVQIGGGKPVRSSPAIGPDGTVYVGSDDGRLYALDPATGAENWSYGIGGAITSSPAVGANGLIYVGSTDSKLHVLTPNGQLQSTFQADSAIDFSSPAIGADGTLYIGTRTGAIYALREGGPTPTPAAAATATPAAPAAAPPTPTPTPSAPPAPPPTPASVPTDRAEPIPGALYFFETGHNVYGGFLTYFTTNGGLEAFGYPITEEFQEPNQDGTGR
ncbi:MAG: PQQ-binding-like beta-propeller repeat protein, partial [Chloroflexota bacterium]